MCTILYSDKLAVTLFGIGVALLKLKSIVYTTAVQKKGMIINDELFKCIS